MTTLKEPTIRALVVDDFEPWHDFVSKTLQREPELHIIANAYDGADGVRQALELQPDLILLDIGLPKLNGIEAARLIHQFAPESRILFTTENRSWDIAQAALSTGASGYLVKSSAGSELLPAIDAVLQGKQFVSARLKDCNLIDNADCVRREEVIRPSQLQTVSCHGLRVYANDIAFVDGLAQSIKAALENGNASIIIASESHCSDVLQKLRADGVDVPAGVEQSLLVLLDVADSLSTFMVEPATNDIQPSRSGRMPEVIAEAVQTAKARHLHVAVG